MHRRSPNAPAGVDAGGLLLAMLSEAENFAGAASVGTDHIAAGSRALGPPPRLPREMWYTVLGMIAEVDMLCSGPAARGPALTAADQVRLFQFRPD